MIQPRGIRNNNPLNLRDTRQNWMGEAGADADGFLRFDSPFYGIRAAARVLQTYARRGVVTLAAIVEAWAPPAENDTAAYIAHAAQATGIAPGEAVDPSQYPALLAVMIRHENGEQPYPATLIEDAARAAA